MKEDVLQRLAHVVGSNAGPICVVNPKNLKPLFVKSKQLTASSIGVYLYEDQYVDAGSKTSLYVRKDRYEDLSSVSVRATGLPRVHNSAPEHLISMGYGTAGYFAATCIAASMGYSGCSSAPVMRSDDASAWWKRAFSKGIAKSSKYRDDAFEYLLSRRYVFTEKDNLSRLKASELESAIKRIAEKDAIRSLEKELAEDDELVLSTPSLPISPVDDLEIVKYYPYDTLTRMAGRNTVTYTCYFRFELDLAVQELLIEDVLATGTVLIYDGKPVDQANKDVLDIVASSLTEDDVWAKRTLKRAYPDLVFGDGSDQDDMAVSTDGEGAKYYPDLQDL